MAIPANDQDEDIMVHATAYAISPLDIMVDSTTSRKTCNTPFAVNKSYKGDSDPDELLSPDYVEWAMQWDAIKFADDNE